MPSQQLILKLFSGGLQDWCQLSGSLPTWWTRSWTRFHYGCMTDLPVTPVLGGGTVDCTTEQALAGSLVDHGHVMEQSDCGGFSGLKLDPRHR